MSLILTQPTSSLHMLLKPYVHIHRARSATKKMEIHIKQGFKK